MRTINKILSVSNLFGKDSVQQVIDIYLIGKDLGLDYLFSIEDKLILTFIKENKYIDFNFYPNLKIFYTIDNEGFTETNEIEQKNILNFLQKYLEI